MDRKVSVTYCAEYEIITAEDALKRLLMPLGGLGWVKKGMRIAVKANLLGMHKPEAAATTHPVLICALSKMLAEKGASVVVGDSPGGLYTKSFLSAIYKSTEMTRAEAFGARLNDDFTVEDISFPEAVRLKKFRVTKYLTEADAVINFCKLKTHALMAYTGACKNMYGAVPGMLKSEYHYLYPTAEAFADMLVDINDCLKPVLNIADAVWAMEGNGPSNGSPRFIGALIASQNPHALDLAGARMIGLGPDDVPTLAAAVRRGLIPDRFDKLDIAGDIHKYTVGDFKRQPVRDVTRWGTGSRIASSLLRYLLASEPRADKKICIGCEKCAAHCPAKAITFKDNRPRIDKRACIRCFCCQEFCPKGAISVHRPLAARVLSR